MKRSEFMQRVFQNVRAKCFIKLTIRGNYGNYVAEGIVEKVEDGRIYLRSGMSHHYRRIVKIEFH